MSIKLGKAWLTTVKTMKLNVSLCTISFDFTYYALIIIMPQCSETLNVTKIF